MLLPLSTTPLSLPLERDEIAFSVSLLCILSKYLARGPPRVDHESRAQLDTHDQKMGHIYILTKIQR